MGFSVECGFQPNMAPRSGLGSCSRPVSQWTDRDIEGWLMDSHHRSDTPVVKSTDDARASVTGHRVRYVSGFGLAGAVLAFVVLSVYFGFGGV
jgi:hypothetical protein